MTLSIPMIRGRAAVLLAVAFVSIACAGPPVAPPPPPPDVTVATPAIRDVTNYAEFTGRTASIATVEIRARVAGELQRMEFEPSSQVTAGDLLFVIEPEPYEAALDIAMASIARWEAELARAEAQLSRLELALQTEAVSE